MEYTVVREKSIINLISRVNYLIKEGWEPLGGISFKDGDTHYHMQAMTLESKAIWELGSREPLATKAHWTNFKSLVPCEEDVVITP